MRRALVLFLFLGAAFAQSAFDEMRSNLDQGYYAIAAQVLGPNLVDAYPDDAEAHYLYAYALYLSGTYAQARQELDAALSLVEGEADARLERLNGLLYATEGDSAKATELLQRAFERSGDYDTALDWGRVSWQMGDYEQALAAFGAAAATPAGQRDFWAQLNRGRILQALSRYPEAIEAFNAAIDIFEANDPGQGLPSPGYVEAFFRLGEIYEAQGDTRQARAFYEAARNSDPNYTPAVNALDRLVRSP
jgi:tetratricopeptide (TPR) repeat protein